MSHSVYSDPQRDISTLKYIITHVFCPLRLPDVNDHSVHNDNALVSTVVNAARLYSDRVDQECISEWRRVVRMLGNLQVITGSGNVKSRTISSQFNSLEVGDVLALPIQAQNAGIVLRKQKSRTIFESFELSPPAEDVMSTEGKLICSFPGPAIEIPNVMLSNGDFRSELVNFLVHMIHDKVNPHEQYITELLTGILRSVGRPADVHRIRKRIGDDAICNRANDILRAWRRSPLWLLVRVAIQTTLDYSFSTGHIFKEFALFFMCRLAVEKGCKHLPSDLLHFMSTKISRRLRKLGSSVPDWLSYTVLHTCTSLRSTIEERWRKVQASQRSSPLWTPSRLDFTRDIRLSLSNSHSYLQQTIHNHSIHSTVRLNDVPFPQEYPRGDLEHFLSFDGEIFGNSYRAEPFIALFDVEQAVEREMDSWVESVINSDHACVKLENLLYRYTSNALKVYANKPECLSLMLLTAIELWVALDKIAVKEIPLLAEYSPEILPNLLDSLLLSKSAGLHRLRNAHEYLSRRHSQSRNQWSAFYSTTTSNSFAVRFYKQSLPLRRSKSVLQVERYKIIEAFAEVQNMDAYHHEGGCNCIDGLLSSSNKTLQSQTMVFELCCPISFNAWRTSTLYILLNFCSTSPLSDDLCARLSNYRKFQQDLRRGPGPRIFFGSQTRRLLLSRRYVTPPTKQEWDNVKTAFRLFHSNTWSGILGSATQCAYQLQNGIYQNLQKYVSSTSHTSNEVIANQAKCHEDLSIHEYMAFGHLRSGGLLQWLNILRELRSRSFSFRCPEVHMLFAQATSQVGPFANTEWTWHQDIREPAFCHILLHELGCLARDVQANWKEVVTMDTISVLLRRLLASGLDDAIRGEAVNLLRTVRDKVFSWVQELSADLTTTPADEESRGILCDAAAICRGTFDVDSDIFPELLCSAEDLEVFLLSAMVIHDNIPVDASRISEYSQLLLDRDRRLSLALQSFTSGIIQTDLGDQGINMAVRRIWPDYQPGSMWRPLASNSRWVFSVTTQQADRHSQVVHFNLLDGSLFVDGKQLGTRLPDEIVCHPLYKLIFGEHMLKAVPGDLLGMDYCVKDLVSGHRVYLSLRNDLVIRARRMGATSVTSELLELIPRYKLEGDLPTILVEGHAHWLHLTSSVIEIRPLDNLWEDSLENWRIYRDSGHYYMRRGQEYFVNIQSRSWHMVSSLLRPLCTPQDLVISVSLTDPSQPVLSAVLPRYDLSFYVDEDGDLQSCDIRGMVYDENQSIGTFFGLVNQLVLRPKCFDASTLELIPRCVLIPDGEVLYETDGHHVRVEITPRRSASDLVTYQKYEINTDQGCLKGNPTFTSMLYCAYLHAVTSSCSIDPLTGRLGIEEALSVLRAASCYSSVKPSRRDEELLGLIALICPSQEWSSQQFIRMVEWRNLPETLENYELYTLAKVIKEHHQRVRSLYEGISTDSFEGFPMQDDHLFRRGAQRAAYLAPLNFSRQPAGSNPDARYDAGDPKATGELRAYTAATLVYLKSGANTKDIWKMMVSWATEITRGSQPSLGYDKSWLALDLPQVWIAIYDLLRKDDERKWFKLLFSLPAMAYASPNLSDLVPVFVAFASHSQFHSENPPHYTSFTISRGTSPSSGTLGGYVVDCAYPLAHSPEYHQRDSSGRIEECYEVYKDRLNSDADRIARKLLSAWPCETCPSCSLDPYSYDVAKFKSDVGSYFSECFRNFKLEEHVTRVQAILDDLYPRGSTVHDIPGYIFPSPSHSNPQYTLWQLSMNDLFARAVPPLQAYDRLRVYPFEPRESVPSDLLPRLIDTIQENTVNQFQRRYVAALRSSAKSFASEICPRGPEAVDLPTKKILVEYYNRRKSIHTEALHHLLLHLGPRSQGERAMKQSGQWPRITSHELFRYLASDSPITLPDSWKKCLIQFTLLTLELQRARRLVLLHINNLHEELCRELQNEGYDSLDAEACPDWLLIQFQSNFLVRRIQVEIAREMISPRSGDNTAMQLNMGEGKSSVIVPLVAAVLANGEQLVRVIVPKPLTVQTLLLLTSRLGGLTNRRVFYLPISRSLDLDVQKATILREILLECMRERGILVVQPDHILSLKLMSVEMQLSHPNDENVGHQLLELQRWLSSHSRDILDESDEILDVRSQLVFALGHQKLVDASPGRWTTIGQVLGLVREHTPSLQKKFPLGVEYRPGPPGSFPYLRILRKDAGEQLISRIVEDVIQGRVLNVSFAHLHFHPGLEDAIRVFVSKEDVSLKDSQSVKEYFERTSLWSVLLQLRGLLATGILLYALRERRWRVDYGLFPSRTMLAVPYRAKDVPAQKAEFCHPDIAIILTCLSYYYAGLSEEQLRVSFDVLFEARAPSSDYELWVRACPTIPEFLRGITGVNVNSTEQWDKVLFPLFSRNRATIDFYLSNVVFPREAKECPSKLSSSSWDLAEKKERPLTGFSGTNDGQHLFPLHITQRDPDHQRGTNAKVLSYLLQPENNHYMCMVHQNEKKWTTGEFLQTLVSQKPEVRVLLDVGAQMLDLQNHELAVAWLEISDASAAIYFNECDELTVCTRDGNIQLLILSPFAQQLDRCVIYLDDAHTRGTDIKFPNNFRAAVTLGPKVTKDRLAQGCMRMRKLGHGHSVIFFAPLEVDQRIRAMSGKDKTSDGIDVADVLHWSIRETWECIQRWAPHWAQQGTDHASRYAAWSGFCNNQLTPQSLSEKWLQPEAKTLEELYEPHGASSDPSFVTSPDIRQRCNDIGVLSLSSVGIDGEQERELAYEVKRERGVQVRPSAVPPAKHSIHQDVIDFITTGLIPTGTRSFNAPSNTFTPAFETLHATRAATDEAYVWSQSVLVTTDFQRTVLILGMMDDYLRPVHWIVSAKRGNGEVFVILSPYEVNHLLPMIRSSEKVHLHLYTPRFARSMKSCDNLAFYNIPAVPDGWLSPISMVDQLNMFAGQLYLKDYETYLRLCRFLGVYARDLEGVDGIVMEPDGFILPKNRNRIRDARKDIAHTFARTPLMSLRTLMNIRSKGIDFTLTHMGKLLHGRLLSESDFSD